MLSIVIPVLNEEKALGRNLQALKELKSIEHEIIVSDSNSSDRTVEIAMQYADIVIETKIGLPMTIAKSRNLGASKAKGDFLVFLDADITVPDADAFFLRAMKEFEADKDLVALSVYIKVHPESATFLDNAVYFFMNAVFAFYNNFLHTGIASAQFMIIRTDIFRHVSGFNEKLIAAEDVDIFKRLSLVGDTKIVKDLNVFHTARRAHKMGWPKLLSIWAMNTIYVKLFKRSYSHDWMKAK